MTEEQIKQNAESIVQELSVSDKVVMYSRSNMISAAIAGVHSRDKEIEELELSLEAAADVVKRLTKQLNELRNPWISVKDRSPVPHTPVYAKNDRRTWFFALRTGNRVRPWYDIVGRHPEEVTHWKPIPELKKGE